MRNDPPKLSKSWVALAALIATFNLGLLGLVLYVAWHFVSKFW